MKTIKEIAEQFGVSKTAIYALIKSHNIPTTKGNGLTYVNDSGLSLILAHYTGAQHESIKDIIKGSFDVESTSVKKIENTESLLNEQIINILEKQLDDKQEVIKGLLQALTYEQQLRVAPLLSDKQADSIPPRKSFWERFKKR